MIRSFTLCHVHPLTVVVTSSLLKDSTAVKHYGPGEPLRFLGVLFFLMTFGQVGHSLGLNCSSCGLSFFLRFTLWFFISKVSWLIVGLWLVGWSLRVADWVESNLLQGWQGCGRDGPPLCHFHSATVVSHAWATLFWLREDVSLCVLGVSRSVAWVVRTLVIAKH